MDTIFIHDLRIEARIGVYEWERQLSQMIRLDLEIGVPSAKPFTSGELADALDYSQVVARLKAFVQDAPPPLLERFAEAAAQLLLDEFGVPMVRLRVAKLAPIAGVKEMGVAIERRRSE